MLYMPLVILMMDNERDCAFMESLYADNYRVMRFIAARYARSRQDIDDIVSDACVSLIGKISVIRHFQCNNLTAYIVKVVEHTAISRLRKENDTRYADNGEEILLTIDSGAEEPLARLIRDERVERLKRAIETLPERDQKILNAKYILGYSDKEIATEFGIRESNVRVILFRAKKRAYERIKEMDTDES